MPRLACRTCGRQVSTVSPIESLLPDELRCPRCGAHLQADRREAERRVLARRVEPPDERRVAQRRDARHPGAGAAPRS
jgi:DNA-directed RNA polymerase subunit RPC12/RpoP